MTAGQVVTPDCFLARFLVEYIPEALIAWQVEKMMMQEKARRKGTIPLRSYSATQARVHFGEIIKRACLG